MPIISFLLHCNVLEKRKKKDLLSVYLLLINAQWEC